MLVQAEGRTCRIQDGTPLWDHAGYFFVKPPSILDGYVFNDIWTRVVKLLLIVIVIVIVMKHLWREFQVIVIVIGFSKL